MIMYENKAKRIYLENQIYFVTSKTFKNNMIFKDKIKAAIFWHTLLFLKNRSDFDLYAVVLLADHFHLLLKPIKKNISQIMHDLKSYTTAKISEQILLNKCRRGVEASPIVGYLNNYYRQGFHALPPISNRKTISIKIWQRSFYYHLVISEEDFENHFNYIIYNPQKHGYALHPKDWPWLWYDFNISP